MAGASKLFVAGTTAPDSLSLSTQQTVSTSSVREVAKLSPSEKANLEKRSGINIENDVDLMQAKTMMLSKNKKDTLTVVGTDQSKALITGDDASVREINKLIAEIDAIEATRDDCPDWLGNCPTLPGLGIKKALLALLEDARRFADKLNQLKKYMEDKLVNSDYLDAWLRCATYVSKKGLEGVRQLNKVGKVLETLQDQETWAAYVSILADTSDIASTISDPSAYLRNNLKSKSGLSLTGLIKACQDLKVNPSNLLNPFDSIPRNGSQTKSLFGDFEVFVAEESSYNDLMGNKSNSNRTRGSNVYSDDFGVYALTNEEKQRGTVLAQLMGVEENNIAMNQRASVGIANKETIVGNDIDEITTVAVVGVGLNSSNLQGNDDYLKATYEYNKSQAMIAAINQGQPVTVSDSDKIYNNAFYQTQVAKAVKTPSSPNITTQYTNTYSNIMVGYA